MRLTKISFNGFKRLADTSCNVDGRLTAFLGPNEAGKSSVLEALAWLSDTDSGALPLHLHSRALGQLVDEQAVVTARFAIEEADAQALLDVDTDVKPRYYIVEKWTDGSLHTRTEPPVTRRRTVLDEAMAALGGEGVESLAYLLLEKDGLEAGHQLVMAALREGDRPLTDDDDEAFAAIVEWLQGRVDGAAAERAVTNTREDEQAPTASVAETLLSAQAKLKEPDVLDQCRTLLRGRRPRFLLFADADRTLASSYNLAALALYDDTPPALSNLLKVAGTNVLAIRNVQKTGDVTRIQTLLKTVNRVLQERLRPTWKQSEMTVRLLIDGDQLQVLVDEIDDDGATTDFAERSDGLRTFVALVCFLADKADEAQTAPVLLIDEAETHLHYDAQADLINVLRDHVRASKVIYTTHSPGCLPPDLGTGIRFVAPSRSSRATSTLRSDFWSSSEPGFSPILFAMGASAAAFSVCRSAVVAEGPSDMILLPSLLRMATGLPELGYQVAPGLSNWNAATDEADVAARVVYLADGDEAGEGYRQSLLARGIAADRVQLLPSGQAIEDLLQPDSYLSAVRQLMRDAGHLGGHVDLSDLDGSGPIAVQVRRWCGVTGAPLPGKTAVATFLTQETGRITLATGAVEVLQRLHGAFESALS